MELQIISNTYHAVWLESVTTAAMLCLGSMLISAMAQGTHTVAWCCQFYLIDMSFVVFVPAAGVAVVVCDANHVGDDGGVGFQKQHHFLW